MTKIEDSAMKLNSRVAILLFSCIFSISSTTYAGSILSPLTDSVNSGIINTKIETDDNLGRIDIDATVENGIVIYSGRVNSMRDVNELMRIARSVSGIKGVNTSRLYIGPRR